MGDDFKLNVIAVGFSFFLILMGVAMIIAYYKVDPIIGTCKDAITRVEQSDKGVVLVQCIKAAKGGTVQVEKSYEAKCPQGDSNDCVQCWEKYFKQPN